MAPIDMAYQQELQHQPSHLEYQRVEPCQQLHLLEQLRYHHGKLQLQQL